MLSNPALSALSRTTSSVATREIEKEKRGRDTIHDYTITLSTCCRSAAVPDGRHLVSYAADVRDDVLARLLALNAERYAEEVAQGLHNKGKKTTASTAGQKRGRPAKAAASASSEQMGLGL